MFETICGPVKTEKRAKRTRFGSARGFSLVELMMAILVGMILTAIALPEVQSSLYNYRLRGAVSMSTWAIQSTRYQALMEGVPYQVVLTSANSQYQVQGLVGGTYTNVGGVVPLSSSAVALSADTTLNFRPNGSVTAPVGALNFTITYQGVCQRVTVTNYGNVSITPRNPQPIC